MPNPAQNYQIQGIMFHHKEQIEYEKCESKLTLLCNLCASINVALIITPLNETTFYLERIVINDRAKRNRGMGSRIIRLICNITDRYGFRIVLVPSSSFGSDADRLRLFYKRFGFMDSEYSCGEGMVRSPQEYKKQKEGQYVESKSQKGL